MEFLNKNMLDDDTYSGITSTLYGIIAGSIAAYDAYNVLDRDERFTFYSALSGVDYVHFVATFTAAKVLSRIAICGHDMAQFKVWRYTSAVDFTLLSMTTSSGTITSHFSSNSLTSNYLQFDPVTFTAMRIEPIQSMRGAGYDMSIGYVCATSVLLTLPQKPNYSGFSLVKKDKSFDHDLANGGKRYQTIAHKMVANLSFDFIDYTMQQSLYSVYYNRNDFVFVPSPPTTTAAIWDTVIFPCIWANGFDFETYSDNSATPYFSGSVQLMEGPK